MPLNFEVHPIRPVEMEIVETVNGPRAIVRLLDQRRLPREEIWLRHEAPADVALGITTMVVRGAPAIGVTAAYGLAQAALAEGGDLAQGVLASVDAWGNQFARTRPTAVNLFWAIDRMKTVARAAVAAGADAKALRSRLVSEAFAIHEEDIAMNHAMGRHGAPLLPDEGGILTHCNAGALATGGHGTALGVIRQAFADAKRLHVYAGETRPFLQGARLTAWECVRDGMPCTLVTDGMAAWLMAKGRVKAAIVGADRIAANGDTANKIGTYGVAVVCKHHGIPFYVAAPTSTLDLDTADGGGIPIEERASSEVTTCGGVPIAPEGVGVFNPAFDVTPGELVTAIITEKGVTSWPHAASLARMKG